MLLTAFKVLTILLPFENHNWVEKLKIGVLTHFFILITVELSTFLSYRGDPTFFSLLYFVRFEFEKHFWFEVLSFLNIQNAIYRFDFPFRFSSFRRLIKRIWVFCEVLFSGHSQKRSLQSKPTIIFFSRLYKSTVCWSLSVLSFSLSSSMAPSIFCFALVTWNNIFLWITVYDINSYSLYMHIILTS